MSAIDLNKKQQLVYQAILDNPRAADDDAILLEEVWTREGWSQHRSLYENLCSVTRPATIVRRRRELQVMGLVKASDEAEKRREEAFKNERERAAPKAVSWLYG